MRKLLVIERDSEVRGLLERRLGGALIFDSVPSLERAKAKFRHTAYDAVVWNLGDDSAADRNIGSVLGKLGQKLPRTKLFVLSAEGRPEIHDAPERFYHWIKRPFDPTDLCASIGSELRTPFAPGEAGDPQIFMPTEFEGIVAISLPMRTVLQRVVEAAAVDVPVLITGETGTGKDLVAGAIHKRSNRKNSAFLAVNMGAVPTDLVASELFGHERGAYTGAGESRSGIFEQARSGTIFLDEITTMDEKTQVSLLRVLETQSIRRVRGEKDIAVDVRVLAATNENIEDKVKERLFREDLYYRLDVFRIQLPPLRDRPGDISFLTNYFISRFEALYQKQIRMVPSGIYRILRSYPWPGNVRELKNVIQRAVIMAKGAELTPDLLPARIRDTGGTAEDPPPSLAPIHVGMRLDEAEKKLIAMTLSSVGGNKLKAASLLGISRRTLYDKLKKYGVL